MATTIESIQAREAAAVRELRAQASVVHAAMRDRFESDAMRAIYAAQWRRLSDRLASQGVSVDCWV
jgi:muconolactone delta-isomerase